VTTAIAYCIDSKYTLPLAASIRSLVDTLDSGTAPEIFILHSSLPPGAREQVRSAADPQQRLLLNWIEVNDAPVSSLKFGLHFSPANYFRLLLPDLLPTRLESILYLDADTILKSDVRQLFDLFDSSYPLQAVLDYSGTLGNPLVQLENPLRFGLSPSSPYYNSGVLLMNLATWRREKISRQIIQFAQAHPDSLFFVDQTAINIVLSGRIGELPSTWNAQTEHPNVLNGQWAVPFIRQDLSNARLIHFTSEFKPWSLGRDLPHSSHFHEVRSRFDWA